MTDAPARDAASDRRPIRARSHPLVGRLVRSLARLGATPNGVSLASIAFAGMGAAALTAGPGRPLLFLLAALAIQGRLLCNLVDGMLAVEGGRVSAVGALYNEFPDRVADTLLLVALGHAAGAPALGWAAALAAALTAYVRATGGALGLSQDFRGPMAKPHRMAVLTGACALAPLEVAWWGGGRVLEAAAWIILLGALLTCAARTRAIARGLAAREAAASGASANDGGGRER